MKSRVRVWSRAMIASQWQKPAEGEQGVTPATVTEFPRDSGNSPTAKIMAGVRVIVSGFVTQGEVVPGLGQIIEPALKVKEPPGWNSTKKLSEGMAKLTWKSLPA
jgi:hypothetical protein